MPYQGIHAKDFGFKLIKYEKRDLRATVTFNRPKVHNAVNGDMLVELAELLDRQEMVADLGRILTDSKRR